MSLTDQLRGFWRALRRGSGRKGGAHRGHSLARALKESTQLHAARGGVPRASTEAQHRIVAEGHESYSRSFDDEQ